MFKGAAAAGLAAALWKPGVAAAGAPKFTASAANKLLPHPQILGNPKQEQFWSQVRKAFTLGDYIHMNTGTTGSPASYVLNNLAVYEAYKALDPRDWELNMAADFPDLFTLPAGSTSAIGDKQAQIAAMYGADPSEIVLSYNTTHGLAMIFSGIKWNPNDRIITIQMEHPAGIGPISVARDVFGVEVAIIDLPSYFDASVPEVVSWFQAALAKPLKAGGTKQIVWISEIPYKNGVRLPIKEITAAAHASGAWIVVDSAHGWGQLPVNCHDYGADFIAGAGHKWLCGGPGTGILYVRNQGSNLIPFNFGQESWGTLFQVPNPRTNDRTKWTPAAQMQGTGEYNRPAVYSMTDSALFFEYIGLQNIYDRGVALAAYLQSKVAARWGAQALSVSPTISQPFRTFLTAFNPFKAKNDPAQYATMTKALSSILTALAGNEPKVYIRSITWKDKTADPGTADNRCALRVSTHAMYNNTGEIDVMFAALTKAVDSAAAANGLQQA
jgi:selenocysteine lyase/cysteine desulfurase